MEQAEENKAEKRELTPQEWAAHLHETFTSFGLSDEPSMLDSASGIRYDYCHGARILLPQSLAPKTYEIRLFDLDSGSLVEHLSARSGDYVISDKKYYVHWGIEIYDGETKARLLRRECSLEGCEVLVSIPVDTLGDNIAWFASVPRFAEKHKCHVTVRMSAPVAELFMEEYPELSFGDGERRLFHAAYRLALFLPDKNMDFAPVRWQTVPLHHYASYILGLPPCDEPPRIRPNENKEIPDGDYACVAVQASGQCKAWHNPVGWDETCAYLQELGLAAYCIDLKPLTAAGPYVTRRPYEAIDMTGRDFGLRDRAAQISGSRLFIGVGSGLAWLAWCCRVPVVLVSGFSESWAEFPTPWRIINRNVCHGCFNDVTTPFDSKAFDWCPRHRGTLRQWECSRAIGSKAVKAAIADILGVEKEKPQEKKD